MLKILAPTDFSTNAHYALLSALKIAKCYGAEIILLHVIHQPLVPATSPNEVYSSLFEADRERAIKRLQEQRNKVYEEASLRLSEVMNQLLVLPAPLTDAVLQVVNQSNVDLIVMGISGSNGLKRLLIGSNTLEIVSITPIPLIVIPHGFQFKSFSKITIVIEKKLKHRPGLKLLFRLIRTYSSQLYLFFVTDEEDKKIDLKGQQLTSEELSFFKEAGFKSIVVPEDSKEGMLKRHLKETEADLIVTIPKHRSGWDDRFSSDFSLTIAEKMMVPLLVIPKTEVA